MVRLINEERRANGLSELPVHEALMNATQDCAAHQIRDHSLYEWEVLRDYGWPYGGGFNLTCFTATGSQVRRPDSSFQLGTLSWTLRNHDAGRCHLPWHGCLPGRRHGVLLHGGGRSKRDRPRIIQSRASKVLQLLLGDFFLGRKARKF